MSAEDVQNRWFLCVIFSFPFCSLLNLRATSHGYFDICTNFALSASSQSAYNQFLKNIGNQKPHPFFIPPANFVCRGILFSRCPCVRPSVRPCVRASDRNALFP